MERRVSTFFSRKWARGSYGMEEPLEDRNEYLIVRRIRQKKTRGGSELCHAVVYGFYVLRSMYHAGSKIPYWRTAVFRVYAGEVCSRTYAYVRVQGHGNVNIRPQTADGRKRTHDVIMTSSSSGGLSLDLSPELFKVANPDNSSCRQQAPSRRRKEEEQQEQGTSHTRRYTVIHKISASRASPIFLCPINSFASDGGYQRRHPNAARQTPKRWSADPNRTKLARHDPNPALRLPPAPTPGTAL